MGQPHVPSHQKQVIRLTTQLQALEENFARYKASLQGKVTGLEPESVLVIEIAGKINDFTAALGKTGLEWVGEWDLEGFQSNEDFYEVNQKGEKLQKPVGGQLFLSLTNEDGLKQLLSLWETWKNNNSLPPGKTKWRDVFSQITQIRQWGIEETIRETGMADRWRELLDPIAPEQMIQFQIELFYRANSAKRRQNEGLIRRLLADLNGKTLSSFIDFPEITFHAVKAELPAASISKLLQQMNEGDDHIDIPLFLFANIMYFRPTGQSLAATFEGDGVIVELADSPSNLPPIAAILDGVPNLQHEALKDRLLLDDPNNLSQFYQPGQRKHGTAMASLVLHGELGHEQSFPLARQVYFHPILQPNNFNGDEHVPENVFLEDRIHIAVKRMFEGQGTTPPQAPQIKIINFSIGDPSRLFIHTHSPLARLLDWLAWKYRVLFCVSAGNFDDAIDIGISAGEFSKLTHAQKMNHTIKGMDKQLSERRLLSPAEAINVLTIGASHQDESGPYPPDQRVDLMGNMAVLSPVSRVGHGFRRSIKPEILFAGGRQLYRPPVSGTQFSIDRYLRAPGQKVASDSDVRGETNRCLHTRGTSNATALATRGGILIYETLEKLKTSADQLIPESLIAILIKTLLVHGARQDVQIKQMMIDALKTRSNSRKIKEVVARFIGYGEVDIHRVLACTEQRATVLATDEIGQDEIHEYRLPIPPSLQNRKDWRRMVVTLAWFSPLNPNHRNLREAKLEFMSKTAWQTTALKIERQDADHNQILRGTVQHEVLEGAKEITTFTDDDQIVLHVKCKADATNALDTRIPYGLAVTLEVEEGIDIPIYQEIKARIASRIATQVR